jgi:hypothetical protein
LRLWNAKSLFWDASLERRQSELRVEPHNFRRLGSDILVAAEFRIGSRQLGMG